MYGKGNIHGHPVDIWHPAAWSDWLECVEKVKSKSNF
jgi:hypothetical protein